MTKHDKLKAIVEIAGDIKPFLRDLKVHEDHLDLHEHAHKLDAEIIKEGFEWLNKIYNIEFTAVKRAKNLLSPERWASYELIGMENFEGHQEVIILRAAQSALRKVIVCQKRPSLFKKSFVKEQLEKK